MIPATPNAVDTLRRPAPLAEEPVALALALALALEPEGVEVPELEGLTEDSAGDEVLGVDPEPVEAGLEPPVPVSETAVLTQEVELPDWTVTVLEYTSSPVLSFRAITKFVLAGRSTFQVYEVPV